MKEKTNMEIFKEKKAGATSLSVFRDRMIEFFKEDEMRYIVLFDAISESDRFQCETLEVLLLKTRDGIKEKIGTIKSYTQRELDVVNFFLDFINFHFAYGFEDYDATPVSQPEGFGVVNGAW